MYLDCCRWEYVKMQSRDDSLWESFPRALLIQEGAGRYISAFQAPFQELPSLSPQQIYTLQACSLLVIPPPIGRTVSQGGFLTDLTELNLLGWAALVQDVVADLQVLPPRLSHDLGLQMVALLQLLEVATGVGFCHHCCNPRPHCGCAGVPQSTPPMSWSQFMEQTPVYGAAHSSSGVTTPSTFWGGMSGYVPPLPGMSVWNMPPLEDATLPEPAAILPYQPPTGGTGWLGTALNRRAPVLQAPQMAPPIHQPPPFPRGWPATLYQQVVQLLGKSSGLGVTFDSSATKPAPTGGQDTNAHRRQGTRG